ncbi:pyroglutamyl-peptidase I [Clostridium sp. P21]|uniref:Pyrrolidone-carboxylate peptidase n=1 Tax=Clostridium muellerianum TaxID=2716538 RepID=A0A7Y0EF23_9CLOT|nr:pyroglutamyl-peptidase I [Clostridium muellerianum]NMM62304.1 pyroglutamyl-peptidase I [Clostridium muellerianum]
MKILITGFEPFGGEKINPALEAIKKVKDNIEGAEIVKEEIPTVFGKSIEKLEEVVKKHHPDAVICVGQAGGRFDITVERVAINMDDARIDDNDGNKPIDEKIFQDGENAYFSTLPIKAIVKEISNNGIPASVSNSAGTFVCNHIMYGLLYIINKKYPNIKGGFIHVPYIPIQVVNKKEVPSMALDDMVKALECAVIAILKNKEDIKLSCGEIC